MPKHRNPPPPPPAPKPTTINSKSNSNKNQMKKHLPILISFLLFILNVTLLPIFWQWYNQVTGINNVALFLAVVIIGILSLIIPIVYVADLMLEFLNKWKNVNSHQVTWTKPKNPSLIKKSSQSKITILQVYDSSTNKLGFYNKRSYLAEFAEGKMVVFNDDHTPIELYQLILTKADIEIVPL